jgi:hypothetical protein
MRLNEHGKISQKLISGRLREQVTRMKSPSEETVLTLLAMISKDKIQRTIQLAGLIGLLFGVWTMLRTPTLILPPWFLVLLLLPILLGVSFILGLATKYLTKNNWSKLTYTAIFVGPFCFTFYILEYVPTRKIIVADSFSGEVRLLLSKDSKDNFELNEYGIGYVSEPTYRQGFKPKVDKAGKDITNDIIGSLAFGSLAHVTIDGNRIGPYKYLSFRVPGQPTDSLTSDLLGLIERNAIDTARLIKE